MRLTSTVLIALVLAATMGVYAVGITLNPMALGGTGSMEVKAPSSGSIQS